MKLLIIGIDGGDQRIFENMEMPFVQSLLKNSNSLKCEEDLWSRGWVEILTGQPSTETGAVYTKPIFKGKEYRFSQSFKKANYYDNPSLTPLWDLLSEAGLKIGMMNWPTTGPASKVNGFFVSGAGGGSGKSGSAEITVDAVYPKDIIQDLKDLDYIFDTRFKASNLVQFSKLMERLDKMQANRTESFIHLSKKFNVDVGLLCFRASTIVQYLAMYDIESIIEGNDNSKERKLIKEFYRKFDNYLSNIFTQINPDEFLIVSDHGSEPRKGTINLNQFLKEKDFLQFQPSFVQLLKRVINKILVLSGKKSRFGLPISSKNTRAFTGRYISGIYINDRKRFNGSIDEGQIDSLVDEIVEVFNNYLPSQKHKLVARPYRRNFMDSYFYDLLPDIWIDRPDPLFFEANGAFIEANREYGPIKESLEEIKRDQHTGTKGRNPLFICSNGIINTVLPNDKKDLTLAYKVISRFLNPTNSN